MGSGSPLQAKAFVAERGLTMDVVVDPRRGVYKALGMVRGVRATFAPSSAVAAAKAVAAGFRQGATQGDPFQQGGVVVVRAGGQVAWLYRSEAAGDHPEPAAVLAALRG